ncbi:hypothetical protein [Campylobacter sp.]|uniref:hypothetical protein n=1 Tax=Campylobacter sp. TaxID=205 RepID=UPI002A56AC85|nr:hypothetical protein [Campylobacter sp.]MDD7090995.1 hypothetical protein [Campylobacteraceae bacterium]MDY5285505.1 hypothetical protein [Campylobacter sp.]
MNKNKMLNDKPIFVAKRRIFRGLIVAAILLMLALAVYFGGQKPEADKVALWVGIGIFGGVGVITLYTTLIFKKIMLFNDRIEVHYVNKVIVRTYSQIKRCYVSESGYGGFTKHLILECEPKFRHFYLSNTLLHKNDLYKIEEILNKKGVKDDDWI